MFDNEKNLDEIMQLSVRDLQNFLKEVVTEFEKSTLSPELADSHLARKLLNGLETAIETQMPRLRKAVFEGYVREDDIWYFMDDGNIKINKSTRNGQVFSYLMHKLGDNVSRSEIAKAVRCSASQVNNAIGHINRTIGNVGMIEESGEARKVSYKMVLNAVSDIVLENNYYFIGQRGDDYAMKVSLNSGRGKVLDLLKASYGMRIPSKKLYSSGGWQDSPKAYENMNVLMRNVNDDSKTDVIERNGSPTGIHSYIMRRR